MITSRSNGRSLRVALAYYAPLGIRFRAVLTDNGPAYRSRVFTQACHALGLKHRFTRPYTRRTNGKAERFIQTALREWAYARTYQNSNERSQELRSWLHTVRTSSGSTPASTLTSARPGSSM
jgi:transposase InsO family protein